MNPSRKLMETVGKQFGPIKRIAFALASVFTPGWLVFSILRSYLAVIDNLDEKELRELVAGIKK